MKRYRNCFYKNLSVIFLYYIEDNLIQPSKESFIQVALTTKILLPGANIWYFSEAVSGLLSATLAERTGGEVPDITRAWATYLIMTGVL